MPILVAQSLLMTIHLRYLQTKENEMAALGSLKLISAKKANTASPVQQRRNKLSKKIWQQMELVKAVANGQHYAQRRFRTVKGADGSRTSVEVETAVRQWWWQQDNGKLALSVRYGSKPIALSAKANAVECADYEELMTALATIRAAVEAGELDAQIEAASTKLRNGFRK
jgi:hypothetical protein